MLLELERILPLRALMCGLVLCGALGGAVSANAEDIEALCADGACDVPATAAPYPNIVVGYPLHILTDDEMRALYRRQKAGAWKDMADDEAGYVARNRAVILPTSDKGGRVLVHLSMVEFQSGPFGTKDLVRYTPHMLDNVQGPPPAHHTMVDGCVAMLCGKSNTNCARMYRMGVFRRSDGVQLDPRTQKPLSGGITIDPNSMQPKIALPVDKGK